MRFSEDNETPKLPTNSSARVHHTKGECTPYHTKSQHTTSNVVKAVATWYSTKAQTLYDASSPQLQPWVVNLRKLGEVLIQRQFKTPNRLSHHHFLREAVPSVDYPHRKPQCSGNAVTPGFYQFQSMTSSTSFIELKPGRKLSPVVSL